MQGNGQDGYKPEPLAGCATIDARAIARGLYDMMDSNQRAALKFGLLPAEMMSVLEKSLGEKADSLAVEHLAARWGMTQDEIRAAVKPGGPGPADAAWRARFVQEATRKVTAELYNVAPMLV